MIKSCRNCEFRQGLTPIDIAHCTRTGRFCSHEMQFGGPCGQELKLWTLRRPWWWRLIRRLVW